MITTVAITAYCLDSYPEGSGEIVRQEIRVEVMTLLTQQYKAAWINFARTTGGFIISSVNFAIHLKPL